jgi:glycine/D-amino acid oxidase-like deaminating enzyme
MSDPEEPHKAAPALARRPLTGLVVLPDDDVVDPLEVVANDANLSLSTLRREISRGRGPTITRLSERRLGVRRRHRREWLDSRASVPQDL